jgi:hypothetical protein
LKVYCVDCRFYFYGNACSNDLLTGADTWLRKEKDPKLMNKNNDCLGFKPKDER